MESQDQHIWGVNESKYTFEGPGDFNGIYGAFDPREPERCRYVGKTIDGTTRYTNHLSPCNLIDPNHKNNWMKSIINKGIKIHFKPLEHINRDLGNDGLNKAEIKWIKKLREEGFDLTNGTDGGDGVTPGCRLSEEHKRKIGIKSKGNKHNLGRKQTPEVIEKRIRSMIGVPRTDEVKRKISEKKKGVPQSEEHRRKNSEAKTGEKNPQWGKPHSVEYKRKLSVINGAGPFSDQFGNVYYTQIEAGEAIGADPSGVSRVLNGKLESVKGRIFKYLDKNESVESKT